MLQTILSALFLRFFELLTVVIGFLFPSSRRLAGKLNVALFQVIAVVTGVVKGIGQRIFQVMAVAYLIGFDLSHQVLAFVESIPTQMVDLCQAVASQDDTEFGAELDRFIELAAHDRSHVGLANADDTIVAAAGFSLGHRPLLLIQVLNRPVTIQ